VIVLIMPQRSSESTEADSLVTAALPTAATDMDSETVKPATDTTRGIDIATVSPSSWDEMALECAQWCQAKEEHTKRSVHDLVQNQTLPFLQSIDVTSETIAAAVQSLVSLPSLQRMAIEQTTEIECDEALIRQVQLQVALRLALWVWGKQAFVTFYQSFYPSNQRKRRGKMKRQSTLEKGGRLLQDIIGLLQLGALRLPPQRPFMEFVQQCVSKQHSESIVHLDTVWETFEVDNPFIPKDRDTALVLPIISPPPTKKPVTTHRRGDSAPIEQPTTETTTQSKVDRIDCILKVPNISLIATKRRGLLPTTTKNSLLLDKGQRFVGSHFNTGLTNVQALFRQVPVPLAGATRTQSSKRKNAHQANTTRTKNHAFQSNAKLLACTTNRASATGTAHNVPVDSIEPMQLSMDTVPSPKRQRVTERTCAPSQLSVLDTPRRSRPSCYVSHCVADTPLPRPKRLEPPPRAIAGLTLIKTASSSGVAPVPQRRLSTTQMMPVPAKSLVADALSSLSRRQNRRMSA
jgi:hypothetical protein